MPRSPCESRAVSFLSTLAGGGIRQRTQSFVGGQWSLRADYQRRERQRQKKNDETQPSPEAACEEFFPGV